MIPAEITGGRCCAAGEAGKKGLTRGPGRSDTARGARALAERGSGADKRGRLVSHGGRATQAWASWAVRWEVGAHGAEGGGRADRWVERAGLARALERWAGPGVRKWAGEKKKKGRETGRGFVVVCWVGLGLVGLGLLLCWVWFLFYFYFLFPFKPNSNYLNSNEI